MTPQELVNARSRLETSQRDLSRLLGLSIRSVQAYEQAWRGVPPQVERMVLYLLYQQLLGQRRHLPCWQQTKCPSQWRSHCPTWKYQAQGPCWFINGNFCQGVMCHNWEEKMKTCRTCSVFTEVMGAASEIPCP